MKRNILTKDKIPGRGKQNTKRQEIIKMKHKKLTAVIAAAAICTTIPVSLVFAQTAPSMAPAAYEADTDEDRPELPGFINEGELPELPEGAVPGEMPEMDGERPELPPEGAPESEMPEMNGEQPQLPEGEAPEINGEMPQGDMQLPPEGAPEGEMPETDGERPELPEGEMPGMNGDVPEGMPQGEAPEMNGEMPQGEMPGMNGEQPQMNGEMPQGQPPMQMDGQGMPGKLSAAQPARLSKNGEAQNMQQGQMPQMQQGENGQNAMPGQQNGQPGEMSQNGQPGMPGEMGQPGGMNENAPTSFDAANTPEEDASGAAYTSSSDSENAVLVSGKSLTLSGVSVTKTGSASGEDADFYGTNAAILANNGSDLTITGAEITTDGTHANAVFSNGTGTSVTISDSTITTTGNNSGGLMTTGGASLTATNLTVSTSGNSSAAIRSDRGGGTVNVSEGSYATAGVGSPAIYSTADITVSDADLSSEKSEAVVIEGGNSVNIINSTVSDSNTVLNGQSTVKTNVLIYQSMSGDASEGASSFTMSGGTLIAETGSMFHVTNVSTTIDLTDVDLVYASDSDDFLIASADSWGTSGKNGGNVTLNLNSQTVSGNITVDSVSSLTMTADAGSSYTGAINTSGNAGTVSVILNSGATWTLTGDSYITSFDGDLSAVNLNGYTLYINGTAVQ